MPIVLCNILTDWITISFEVTKYSEKVNSALFYKGLAHKLPTIANGPTVVAVKTLVNGAEQQQVSLFVDEFKVMVKAGHHVNIVNLLGIVQESSHIHLFRKHIFSRR